MSDLLKEHRWVFPDPLWSFPRAMLNDMPSNFVCQNIRAHSSSAIRWYARETDFLVISSSLMLHSELDSGRVVELANDWAFPVSEHVIYYRSVRSANKPIDLAVELFKAPRKPISPEQTR